MKRLIVRLTKAAPDVYVVWAGYGQLSIYNIDEKYGYGDPLPGQPGFRVRGESLEDMQRQICHYFYKSLTSDDVNWENSVFSYSEDKVNWEGEWNSTAM